MNIFSKMWGAIKKAFTKNDNSKKATATQGGSKKSNKATSGSIIVDNSSSETNNVSQTIAEQNNIGVQNNYSNAPSVISGIQEPNLNELEKKIFDKVFADGQNGEQVLLNDICENEHFFADALRTLQEKKLIYNHTTVKSITYSGKSGTIQGTPNDTKFAAKLTIDGLYYGNKLKKKKR